MHSSPLAPEPSPSSPPVCGPSPSEEQGCREPVPTAAPPCSPLLAPHRTLCSAAILQAPFCSLLALCLQAGRCWFSLLLCSRVFSGSLGEAVCLPTALACGAQKEQKWEGAKQGQCKQALQRLMQPLLSFCHFFPPLTDPSGELIQMTMEPHAQPDQVTSIKAQKKSICSLFISRRCTDEGRTWGKKKQQGMVREKAKHDNKAMKTKPVCHIPCCPDNSGNISLTESFKTYLTVPKLCSPVQTGPRATLG